MASNLKTKTELANSRDFQILKQQLNKLKTKFNTTEKELFEILEEKYYLPTTAFQIKELSSFELIVKYLKENKKLTNSQIALITQRSQKTIWTTYFQCQKKTSRKIKEKKQSSKNNSSNYNQEFIPINILQDRKFSPLENIVSFLIDSKKLSLTKIAKLLNKNPKTIWTINSRRLLKC